ncbi:MAG: flagellar basal body L-ring protein FlgH, partial [Aeromonas salmonicida]
RIHYGGTGDLANSQEQGWLTSFFNGPWWPL